MNRIQKLGVLGVAGLAILGVFPAGAQEDEGWVSLFDGKTLSG